MSGIDIVGKEATALATEIYKTLRAIVAEGKCSDELKKSIMRCIRKLEDTLGIPQSERLTQS